MHYPKQIWDQLKNLTKAELIRALERDGWKRDMGSSSIFIYRHPDGRRVSIHFHHASDTCGKKLLNGLLDDINWSLEDLKRVKLV